MIIILDSDACGRLGFISLSITDRFNLLPVCILLPLVEVGTLQSKPVPPLLSVKNVALMTRARMAFEFGRKEKKHFLCIAKIACWINSTTQEMQTEKYLWVACRDRQKSFRGFDTTSKPTRHVAIPVPLARKNDRLNGRSKTVAHGKILQLELPQMCTQQRAR